MTDLLVGLVPGAVAVLALELIVVGLVAWDYRGQRRQHPTAAAPRVLRPSQPAAPVKKRRPIVVLLVKPARRRAAS